MYYRYYFSKKDRKRLAKAAAQKPKTTQPRQYLCEPNNLQIERLERALDIVKKYKYRPKQKLIKELLAAGFEYPTDKRIYTKGGIGAYKWLPKKACFRVQIAASHIDIHNYFMPYALCIDIL